MALGFQFGAFQSVGFQDEPGAVQAAITAEIGVARYYKKKKKKGGTVIRRSDFESLIAYEEALRELLRPIPMSEVPLEGNVVTVEEDEDDDTIAVLLAKVLH